jgi:hypothetical protein
MVAVRVVAVRKDRLNYSLQFRPRSPNLACNPIDGGGDCKSRLDAGGNCEFTGLMRRQINRVKLVTSLLIVSALMSFGCATSNPNPMPPRAEPVQETQNSGADAPWQWQVLYDLVSLAGSALAGKNAL